VDEHLDYGTADDVCAEGSQARLTASEKTLLRKERDGVRFDDATGVYTREVNVQPRIWVEPENRNDVLADAHRALEHLLAGALYDLLRSKVWWRT